MSKTIGYVVVNGASDSVMVLCDDVLMIPGGRVPVGTVFPTLKAARAAIKRTNAYADLHGYPWSRVHRITRLTAR